MCWQASSGAANIETLAPVSCVSYAQDPQHFVVRFALLERNRPPRTPHSLCNLCTSCAPPLLSCGPPTRRFRSHRPESQVVGRGAGSVAVLSPRIGSGHLPTNPCQGPRHLLHFPCIHGGIQPTRQDKQYHSNNFEQTCSHLHRLLLKHMKCSTAVPRGDVMFRCTVSGQNVDGNANA